MPTYSCVFFDFCHFRNAFAFYFMVCLRTNPPIREALALRLNKRNASALRVAAGYIKPRQAFQPVLPRPPSLGSARSPVAIRAQPPQAADVPAPTLVQPQG